MNGFFTFERRVAHRCIGNVLFSLQMPTDSVAAPTKRRTALERCIALNFVYGTGARSGQFKK